MAQAEAQGTSLHFMLASVFMCSQVVLLVSSQSGSCGVPRAPATKTLRRVFSMLWRQNGEQTLQNTSNLPSLLLTSSCFSVLSPVTVLPWSPHLSLSPSLASSPSVPTSPSAASEQTRTERRPQIPGSGPDLAELGAAAAAAAEEEADPGGD